MLLSCSKQISTGKYIYKNGLVGGSLVLKDSTFSYSYSTDLSTSNSRGVWKQIGNKLYLKSFETFQVKNYEVIENTVVGKDYIIKVVTPWNSDFDAFTISVDGRRMVTDKNGTLQLQNSPKVITWNFLSEKINSYPVKSKKSNLIVIKLLEPKLSDIYFDNSFRIKDNDINIEDHIFRKNK